MNTQAVAVEAVQRRPVMPAFHGSWSLGALVGAGIGAAAVALGVPLSGQILVLGTLSLAALAFLTKPLLRRDRRPPDDVEVGDTRVDGASAEGGGGNRL